MKRFIICLALILLCLPVFSGCSPEHYEMTNLKQIDIAAVDDYTTVSLIFVNGSYNAGYNEYAQQSLPQYNITMLEQPKRLKIEIQGLSFWDGAKEASIDETGIVAGIFCEIPAGGDKYVLYLQLSGNARYYTEQSRDTLNILLTSGEWGENIKYYCLSDSFEAHRKGEWPKELDMTPVLCSDLENKLLISAPFDTEAKADAFMELANSLLGTKLPGAKAYVDTLYGNSLPDYLYESDTSAQTRNVVSVSGTVQNTPVLLQNGRYLCACRDGRILFAKNTSRSTGYGGVTDSETLWILEGGTPRKLGLQSFGSVQQAGFSPDGKYIAVLDDFDNYTLYVYDTINSITYNMADEGFGMGTQSFCWSDQSDSVYAVTGEDEIRLLSCTFYPDGTLKSETLRSLTSPNGAVTVSQGRVFFMEGDIETGEIYEYGTTDRDLTGGFDFIISDDGNYMLVMEASSAEDAGLTSLKLYDIQTGTSKYAVQGIDPESCCFLPDGSSIFYSVYSGEDEYYPYELYKYDIYSGAVSLTALSITGDIYEGRTAGEVYIVYGPDDEKGIYSTYIYDMKED